jgi:hypothetical protein
MGIGIVANCFSVVDFAGDFKGLAHVVGQSVAFGKPLATSGD